MNRKRWAMALVSPVLVIALVGPSGAALAAGGDIRDDSPDLVPVVRHDPAHDSHPEEPGEPENPGELGNPGEHENPDVGPPGDAEDPGDQGDSGQEGEDPRNNGSCLSVSNVAVCIDPPR